MRNLKTLTIAAAGALVLALPLSALALQAPERIIRLHDVQGSSFQAPDALFPEFRLRTQFSMLEANGAIVNQEVDKAALRFAGQPFAGSAGKLTGDWSMALLVDTSGTLAAGNGNADFRKAMDALSRQIDRAGDNVFMSLLTFDDTPRIQQDLTKEREELKKKIATGIAPRAGAKACLNQGLFEAVRRVKDLPTRRAVFVVTASQDGCETPSAQSVIDLAKQNKVQIYAVGLDGYAVSKAALERFTEPTGGIALMTNASESIITFGNQMSLLANQWETAYAFFPAKGPQTAEMIITLKSGTLITKTLNFDVDKDYFPPPKIALKGEVQALTSGLVFNLDITTKERIRRVEARVTDKRSQAEVYRESLLDFAPSNTIRPTKLEIGLEYILTVIAFDEQNRPIASDNREFAFKPPEFTLLIERVEAPTFQGTTTASQSFSVTVRASNPLAVTRYQLFLENPAANNAMIRESEVFLEAGRPLLIPAGDLPNGVYVVRVRALASDQPLGADAAKSAPVSLVRPTGLDNFIRQARDNPLLLLGLVAIVLMALAVLVAVIVLSRNRTARAEKVVEAALPINPRRQAAPIEPQVAAVPQFGQPPQQPAPPPYVSQHGAAPAPPPQAYPSGPVAVPGGSAPTASLRLVQPANVRWEGRVSTTTYTLGRAADNNGVLPVDGASGVSSRHLVLSFEQGRWFATDVSRNGTLVNGQRLTPNQKTPLPPTAMIGLGPTVQVEFRT